MILFFFQKIGSKHKNYFYFVSLRNKIMFHSFFLYCVNIGVSSKIIYIVCINEATATDSFDFQRNTLTHFVQVTCQNTMITIS